ncbi:hypothetical protein B296_00014975 [Ensete ventricosum]|uniref:Uncharacterized protein n=1 Tax=Ensete ventricosum TaxID=4639 RepID=A0A426Z4W5_ENSVE|nr:hypothetical protein B296_00014975 [Ensete ventricosum]
MSCGLLFVNSRIWPWLKEQRVKCIVGGLRGALSEAGLFFLLPSDSTFLHASIHMYHPVLFRPYRPDNELIELLWRNGHVVMHSQSHRRPPGNVDELKQAQKPDQVQKHEQQPLGGSGNLMQDADAASWFQYPLDDSFEKEFCSEFFPEITGGADAAAVSDKISKHFVAEEDRSVRFGSSNALAASAPEENNTMPPPKSHLMGTTTTQQSSGLENAGVVNFSHFSKQAKADLGSSRCPQGHKGGGSGSKAGAQESSMMTVGSSTCGSNQIHAHTDPSNNLSHDAADIVTGLEEDTRMRFLSEGMLSKAHECTFTSTSGGSGSSYGRTGQQNASDQSHKRKARDVDDSGCQSEVMVPVLCSSCSMFVKMLKLAGS